MSTIGENLRRLRVEAGLHQNELAERLHCSKQTISNYENGRRVPDLETINNLASILGTTVESIIYDRMSRPIPAEDRDGLPQTFSQQIEAMIENEVKARVDEQMKAEPIDDPDDWIPLAPGFNQMSPEFQHDFKVAANNLWKFYHDLSNKQRKDEPQ